MLQYTSVDKLWISFSPIETKPHKHIKFNYLYHILIYCKFPQYKIMWISFMDNLRTFF